MLRVIELWSFFIEGMCLYAFVNVYILVLSHFSKILYIYIFILCFVCLSGMNLNFLIGIVCNQCMCMHLCPGGILSAAIRWLMHVLLIFFGVFMYIYLLHVISSGDTTPTL